MIYGNLGRVAFARGLLFSGVAGAALAMPSVAWAQDESPRTTDDGRAAAVAAAEAAAANAPSGSGNEILVTATKREQPLQDVPVAVTVTTADTIERGQIRDLRYLHTVLPTHSVGQRQSSAHTKF